MTPDPFPPADDLPDRRRWQRRPAGKVQAERIPDDDSTPWQVVVRNISQGGIRLVLGNELATGTALSLRLSRPGRASVLISARVVYVLEKPPGNFITGCAFEQPLRDDQFRRLM
ncbi:MAG TPA: PilZ domain-containing protein [Gemmataceae bacterium]|jgi:hypothetical protein|nr:PilZ domain-containing protein [Gemmataceae bacterium]